jgi:hypothetical protein
LNLHKHSNLIYAFIMFNNEFDKCEYIIYKSDSAETNLAVYHRRDFIIVDLII